MMVPVCFYRKAPQLDPSDRISEAKNKDLQDLNVTTDCVSARLGGRGRTWKK